MSAERCDWTRVSAAVPSEGSGERKSDRQRFDRMDERFDALAARLDTHLDHHPT